VTGTTPTVAVPPMLEAQLLMYALLGLGLSQAVGWGAIIAFVTLMCIGDAVKEGRR
jgi:hypothetical protein